MNKIIGVWTFTLASLIGLFFLGAGVTPFSVESTAKEIGIVLFLYVLFGISSAYLSLNLMTNWAPKNERMEKI